MSARIAAILVLLLVVLGGGALVIYQQQRAQQAPNLAALGQPLLEGLKAAEVAAIRIVEPAASLTLAREGERWIIAERKFPADFAKVRDFVLKAIELKVGQSEPLGGADRARLALNEPGQEGAGTLLEFRGADGKPLARLLVGKKHFKRAPENPDKAPGDGRFVLRPAEPTTAYLVADPLEQASARTALWIDKTGYAAEKVRALEVRFAHGGGWRIERARDDADWKLIDAKPGEKLEVIRGNAASYMMGQGALADIAPADAQPADTGLDKPTVVTATTFDGLTYTLRVGKRASENYYARLSIEGTPRKTRASGANESAEDKARRDQEFAERIAALEARLPREKALAEQVLLVPASKLEDILKPRAEMLEKKKL